MKAKLFAEDDDDVVNQIKVLDPNSWPLEVNTGFGYSQVRSLCSRFGNFVGLSFNGFEDFTDNLGRDVPFHLKKLQRHIDLIPCSTADCERGFSCMNIIVNDYRCRLTVKHVAALIFLRLQGPPLKQFFVDKYVTTWIRSHISAIDTQVRPSSSSKNNVFSALWNYA